MIRSRIITKRNSNFLSRADILYFTLRDKTLKRGIYLKISRWITRTANMKRDRNSVLRVFY